MVLLGRALNVRPEVVFAGAPNVSADGIPATVTVCVARPPATAGGGFRMRSGNDRPNRATAYSSQMMYDHIGTATALPGVA